MANTDVFELNVDETCVVPVDDYSLAEVFEDARTIVKHWQADLVADAIRVAKAHNELNNLPFGECIQFIWALRATGTDLVFKTIWGSIDSYRERAKQAYVITVGEGGYAFKRIM